MVFSGLFLSDSILFYFPFCLLPIFFIFLSFSSLPFELEPGTKAFFSFFSFHHSILFYSFVFFAGNSGEEAHSGTWRNWREGNRYGMGWVGRKEGEKGDLFAKTKQNKTKKTIQTKKKKKNSSNLKIEIQKT